MAANWLVVQVAIELKVKARHPCPFLEYSSYFSTNIFSYCNRDYDILMIPDRKENLHLEEAKRLFSNVDDWRFIRSESIYIVMKCLCVDLYERSITSMIQERGGLLEYPIRYHEGWEYHKIRCIDSKIVSGILEEFSANTEFQILSTTDLGIDGMFRKQMISFPDLIHGMTDRQLSIIIRLFEKGYYEIPRKVKVADVAEELGVTRYAVEKTLRKAENKIMKAIIPYLLIKQRFSDT